MCGTSHEFSSGYKGNKKLERQRRRKERQKKSDRVGSPMTEPLLKNHNDIVLNIEEENLLENPVKGDADDAAPLLTESEKALTIKDEDISSLSLSIKYMNANTDKFVYTGAPLSAGNFFFLLLLINSFFLIYFSTEKRSEALNFRRINQLSLRQKSARRRKMWQRVYDENTQQMVWIRCPLKKVKVGSAPFGYTPRHSFATDGKYSMSFASHLSHNMPRTHSNDLEGTDNPPPPGPLNDLLVAASSAPPPSTPDNMTFRPSGGGVGGVAGHAHPSSYVSRSSLMSPTRRTSKDSFGDSVLYSTSPGFTSVFDEEGGLTWQRVDSGAPLQAAYYGPSMAKIEGVPPIYGQSAPSSVDNPLQRLPPANSPTRQGSNSSPVPTNSNSQQQQQPHPTSSLQNHPLYDLPAVAAYTFKDKQMWFLDRMSEIQKPWTDGFVRIEIRRHKILDDSFRAWMQLEGEDLHKWMRYQFRGEAGVDAGGLEREWFGLLVEEFFAPKNGFFQRISESAGGSYHINPLASYYHPNNYLQYFRFIGRVFGKALMQSQSLNANLCLPLRKQIVQMPVTFSDLEFVDEELYKHLSWLKKIATPDMITALCLDFTISYPNPLQQNQIITEQLLPNGQDIMVTEENKLDYLHCRLRHRLLDSIKPQLESLLLGLYEIIPPDLLSVFDYQEFDLLLCGIPQIQLDDWIRHTEYLGEYTKLGEKHPVIRWFWLCVEEMTQEERIKLLQFTTGCARLPVQGFKALQSNDGKFRKFNIQSIPKSVSSHLSPSLPHDTSFFSLLCVELDLPESTYLLQ
jgi:hypothetical protein